MGELPESPQATRLHHDHAAVRWLEKRRRRWNTFAGAEDRESAREDLRRTRPASDPECLVPVFSYREKVWRGEPQSGAERTEAISAGVGCGHDLDQARSACGPESAVPCFEDLIDPVHRKAVARRVHAGSAGTLRQWINGEHGQTTRSGTDPDASLPIGEDGVDVVRRQPIADGVVLEPAIREPPIDPVAGAHPQRSSAVFRQRRHFVAFDVDRCCE